MYHIQLKGFLNYQNVDRKVSTDCKRKTFCCVERSEGQILRRPAFKGRHREQSHHGHEDVVEVEVTVVPHPLVHGRLVHVPVLVHDVRSPEVKEQTFDDSVALGVTHKHRQSH